MRQLHIAYLDTLYAIEFYKTVAQRTGRRAQILDICIAVGGTGSGSSGLAAIGTQFEPFAVICAVLTAASFCLSAAKAAANWSDSPRRALEAVEKLGFLSSRYLLLIEKLNAYRVYTADDEKLFLELRREQLGYPAPRMGDLPDAVANAIQDRVLKSTSVEPWWKG